MVDHSKVSLYRKLSSSSMLDTLEQNALAQLFNVKKLSIQEHFTRFGDEEMFIGFVLSGVLRLYYLSEDGKEYNKHFFCEESFFLSSLNPEEGTAVNIQALTETTLLYAPYQSLMDLSNRYSSIGEFYREEMMKYLKHKQDREIRLLSLQSQDKYALFLMEYEHLLHRIPHYHIASYLGITPTQLSRVRAASEKKIADQPM